MLSYNNENLLNTRNLSVFKAYSTGSNSRGRIVSFVNRISDNTNSKRCCAICKKKVNGRKMHCPKIEKNWPWLDGAQTKNISKKGKHLKM